MAANRPQVVIVGAGFGGLWVARALADEPVQVLLLDRNNFHTFWPLLYQIGAAEIDATEIAYPVRSVLRKFDNLRFEMAEVRDVDLERRVVSTDTHEIPYDFLVLGLGSTSGVLRHPGRRGAHPTAEVARRGSRAAESDPESLRAGRCRGERGAAQAAADLRDRRGGGRRGSSLPVR